MSMMKKSKDDHPVLLQIPRPLADAVLAAAGERGLKWRGVGIEALRLWLEHHEKGKMLNRPFSPPQRLNNEAALGRGGFVNA